MNFDNLFYDLLILIKHQYRDISCRIEKNPSRRHCLHENQRFLHRYQRLIKYQLLESRWLQGNYIKISTLKDRRSLALTRLWQWTN